MVVFITSRLISTVLPRNKEQNKHNNRNENKWYTFKVNLDYLDLILYCLFKRYRHLLYGYYYSCFKLAKI